MDASENTSSSSVTKHQWTSAEDVKLVDYLLDITRSLNFMIFGNFRSEFRFLAICGRKSTILRMSYIILPTYCEKPRKFAAFLGKAWRLLFGVIFSREICKISQILIKAGLPTHLRKKPCWNWRNPTCKVKEKQKKKKNKALLYYFYKVKGSMYSNFFSVSLQPLTLTLTLT